jgi:hypothetical protein
LHIFSIAASAVYHHVQQLKAWQPVSAQTVVAFNVLQSRVMSIISEKPNLAVPFV